MILFQPLQPFVLSFFVAAMLAQSTLAEDSPHSRLFIADEKVQTAPPLIPVDLRWGE